MNNQFFSKKNILVLIIILVLAGFGFLGYQYKTKKLNLPGIFHTAPTTAECSHISAQNFCTGKTAPACSQDCIVNCDSDDTCAWTSTCKRQADCTPPNTAECSHISAQNTCTGKLAPACTQDCTVVCGSDDTCVWNDTCKKPVDCNASSAGQVSCSTDTNACANLDPASTQCPSLRTQATGCTPNTSTCNNAECQFVYGYQHKDGPATDLCICRDVGSGAKCYANWNCICKCPYSCVDQQPGCTVSSGACNNGVTCCGTPGPGGPGPGTSPSPSPVGGSLTISGQTYCHIKGTGTPGNEDKKMIADVSITNVTSSGTTTVATSDANGKWTSSKLVTDWQGAIRPKIAAYPDAGATDAYTKRDNGITCTDSNLEGITFSAGNTLINETNGCKRTGIALDQVNFDLGYCPTVPISPSPSPKISPSPSPSINLSCSSITRNPTTVLNVGDSVAFTCAGQVTNVTIDHYEFRLSANAGVTFTILDDINMSGTTTPYQISAPGDYVVQCKVCSTADHNTKCTNWGEAGGWTPG